MAVKKKKISQLPAAGALDGTELIEIVQGGVNKKAVTGDIGSGGGGLKSPLTANTDFDLAGFFLEFIDNAGSGLTVGFIPTAKQIQIMSGGASSLLLDGTSGVTKFGDFTGTGNGTFITLNDVDKTAILRVDGIDYNLTRLPSYRVYDVMISQTGTNAPTKIAEQNGLSGTPVFSYFSSGEYLLTLAGAFPAGKTFVFCNNGTAGGSNSMGGYRVNNNAVAIRSGGNDIIINASVRIIVHD